MILRKPVEKEAQVVSVGASAWVFGWSPESFKGQRFELCAVKPRGRCIKPVRLLNGKGQIFGTWTVRRGDIVGGFLRLRLA